MGREEGGDGGGGGGEEEEEEEEKMENIYETSNNHVYPFSPETLKSQCQKI